MGVDLLYRRIPTPLLERFIATQNQKDAFDWIAQTWDNYIFTTQNITIYEDGHLHALLNPEEDTTYSTWNVIKGATPLILQPNQDINQPYLNQIYYLYADEVASITQELRKIAIEEIVERVVKEETAQDEYSISTELHSLYNKIINEYMRLVIFFQVASEMSNGVLRWYSG